MTQVDVFLSDEQDIVSMPINTIDIIKNCCEAVIIEESFVHKVEVSVTFVDNEEIKDLNKKFRNKNRVTDVLSFPISENGEYEINHETDAYILGDIVISLEKALAQSKEYGHSFEREIAFLVTHSMLHLFGYDHVESVEEERIMRSKEEKVLKGLNITRDL